MYKLKLNYNEIFTIKLVYENKIISSKKIILELIDNNLLLSFGSGRNLIYRLIKKKIMIACYIVGVKHLQLSEKGKLMIEKVSIKTPLNVLNDDQLRVAILSKAIRLLVKENSENKNDEDAKLAKTVVDSLKIINSLDYQEIQKIYMNTCEFISFESEI